jgi:hypothetical protein
METERYRAHAVYRLFLVALLSKLAVQSERLPRLRKVSFMVRIRCTWGLVGEGEDSTMEGNLAVVKQLFAGKGVEFSCGEV